MRVGTFLWCVLVISQANSQSEVEKHPYAGYAWSDPRIKLSAPPPLMGKQMGHAARTIPPITIKQGDR